MFDIILSLSRLLGTDLEQINQILTQIKHISNVRIVFVIFLSNTVLYVCICVVVEVSLKSNRSTFAVVTSPGRYSACLMHHQSFPGIDWNLTSPSSSGKTL